MKSALKYAAFASALMLTAGSAAWAQSYTTNPGTQGSYSSNQGSYYTGNPGYQGTYGGTQGTYGANQGNWNTGNQSGWNQGMQGTSTPYGQNFSQSNFGSNSGTINTYQEAEHELSKYGYSNIQGLRPTQGWSADAMRNGQRVHVILGENGLVATFPGTGQAQSQSNQSSQSSQNQGR